MMKCAKELIETIRVYGGLLRRGPRECIDRLRVLAEIRADHHHRHHTMYRPYRWEDLLPDLDQRLQANMAAYRDEPPLVILEARLRDRIDHLRPTAPYMIALNADITLARACYLLCRTLKPTIVIETGVGYGMTSSFILQALQVNGRGYLHSIDLPPIWPGADRLVGVLVPDELRDRWRLHRGPSKRILQSLLPQLAPVDLFIHDSLHTYRNMLWEFQTVTPYLAPNAVVVADDVNENRAFAEWAATTDLAYWMTIQQAEKRNLFGIGIFSHRELSTLSSPAQLSEAVGEQEDAAAITSGSHQP
jgi:predicted O-methyltransferase YrrM